MIVYNKAADILNFNSHDSTISLAPISFARVVCHRGYGDVPNWDPGMSILAIL